jgi:hypothetical protein
MSAEQWEHLLRSNPFNSEQAPVAHGWVLEDDRGSIVGIYGNYPFGYQWDGKSLIAGISHSWAVDEEHRRHSLGLFIAYQRQRNVHLLLNTSANREAARVQEVMKTQRVPVSYFSRILLWILNYPEYIAGMLRYKSVPLRGIFKYPIAAGLWSWDRFSRVNALPSSSVEVQSLPDFDERFDHFWIRLREQRNILRAVRAREALAWHFRYAMKEKRLKIFVVERAEGMVGYLLLIRQDLPQTGWRRYRIADLQAIYPDPVLMEALLSAALRYAKEKKAHLLEAVGLDSIKRGILERLRPHGRRMTNWPAWYQAVQDIPGLNFETPEIWDFSLYDGDATIWPASSGA